MLPAHRTGPHHPENHAEQGKPITQPATARERLEQEVQNGIQSTAAACRGQCLPKPAREAPADVALQIDAGYIRSVHAGDGTCRFAAVASKIVHADPGRNLAHAYSIGYDPWAGLRQQAFLGTAGIALSQPVLVLSDGGEDIAWACKLPAAKERVLDWFRIGMRFQHLLVAAEGLRGTNAHQRAPARLHQASHARRQLAAVARPTRQCLQRLREISHTLGWLGRNGALDRLNKYLHTCEKYLINYAHRRKEGRPFTSARAESVVDYVIGQRMKRNGHMQWTRAGSNALLQVRCAVLNGRDIRNFRRWYRPSNLAGTRTPSDIVEI